jgi:hypothetical protein
MLAEISQSQKKLNELAKEGFELDQFKVIHLHGLRTEFYIVTKRKVEAET